VLGIRQDTTKKGTTVTNKYEKNMPKTSSGPRLAIPDEVTIAMGEIAEDMREGLLGPRGRRRSAGDGRPDGGRCGRGVRAPRQTRPWAERGAARA